MKRVFPWNNERIIEEPTLITGAASLKMVWRSQVLPPVVPRPGCMAPVTVGEIVGTHGQLLLLICLIMVRDIR